MKTPTLTITSSFGAIHSLLLVSVFALDLAASTATPALTSGNFNRTGSMNVARESHTSTLLSNGQVLVAGGDNDLAGYLSSAELV